MRRPRQLPAVLGIIALCLISWPALPGGRDVPDAQSDSYLGVPVAGAPCGDQPVVLSGPGWITLEIGTDARGKTTIQPALFGDLSRLFSRWLQGPSSGSCG